MKVVMLVMSYTLALCKGSRLRYAQDIAKGLIMVLSYLLLMEMSTELT